MGKFTGLIVGGLEATAGIVLATTGVGGAVGVWLAEHGVSNAAASLIVAGAGTIIAGLGTALPKGPLRGVGQAFADPIAPRNVGYGRFHVGGTIVYRGEFGDDNKYLDMVIVLADHPCQNVEQLIVDGNYVPIDPTTRCSYSRTSRTYFNGDGNGTGGTDFLRQAGIITVTLSHPVASFLGVGDGDQIKVDHMPNVTDALTMQGIFRITINPTNPSQFTYICAGNDAHVVNAGHITTIFQEYKSKIYMENLLGTQTLGQTFVGMTAGTPYDGDTGNLVTNSSNPWTSDHSCVGCTLVFLRLHYNDQVWSQGIPQISFVVKGKNNIYDPRTGTRSYTENAALCIADYLADTKYGFRLAYGTDIPNAPLIAAANTCDEAVTLANGGTEPRYTCNGTFPVTMHRGDVLQNLLTSCGGRRTDFGGQHIIWPAAWQGVSGSTVDLKAIAVGPVRWSPKVKSRDLFNAVKGTYVSPVNNWQSSDFPAYKQDALHGYGGDNNLAQDGGERRYLDIQLPFTISYATAQRLAKIELLRRRYQGTGTLAMNMSAYEMTPLDVREFTFSYLGWSNKPLEILIPRLKFDEQGSGGDRALALSVEVEVQETDASIYDWSTAEELTPQGYQQPVLPSTRNLAAPTNPALESDINTALVQPDGTTHSRILVTWVDPQDGYFNQGGHIEAQWQLVSSPASPWTNISSILPGIQFFYIDGIEEGQSYNVQIRAVNAAGVPSDWVQAGPVAVSSHGSNLFGPNGGTQWPVYQDALYPQAVFGLKPVGEPREDGSVKVVAELTPLVPPNKFSTLIDAPVVDPAVTVASTGGAIPGNQTFYLAIAALDSGGIFTALSDIVEITVPAGTNTNSIPLSILNYAAGMSIFLIYTGPRPDALSYRRSNSAGASITLTSLASVTGDSYGVPDARFDHFVAGTTKILLAGSFGGTAVAPSTITAVVPSSGNHYKLTLTGAAFTPSALIGRILSSIVQGTGNPTPLQDYAITANDATSVTVVAPPPSGSWGGPSPSFAIGDQVVVRLKSTTYTGGTIGDSLLAMTADAYKGDVLRVFHQDGTNETAFVDGNDATTFTLQSAFGNPLAPVWWWVENSSFSATYIGSPAEVASYQVDGVPLRAEIDNITGFYAVQVFAADADGIQSIPFVSPIRDFWWPGIAGSGGSGGYQAAF